MFLLSLKLERCCDKMLFFSPYQTLFSKIYSSHNWLKQFWGWGFIEKDPFFKLHKEDDVYVIRRDGADKAVQPT